MGEDLLGKLYDGELQMKIKFLGVAGKFTVDLGFEDDCEISNGKFRFRTSKGMNYEKYDDFMGLINDIRKAAVSFDLLLESYEIRGGDYFEEIEKIVEMS